MKRLINNFELFIYLLIESIFGTMGNACGCCGGGNRC